MWDWNQERQLGGAGYLLEIIEQQLFSEHRFITGKESFNLYTTEAGQHDQCLDKYGNKTVHTLIHVSIIQRFKTLVTRHNQ